MKKLRSILILLLAAAMCLSLAACGGDSKPADTQDTTRSAGPAATSDEAVQVQTSEPAEDLPDISAFVGLWKYDSIPFYVIISDEFVWTAINAYGEDTGLGQVVAEDDGVSLYYDGELITAYHKIVGGLADAAGNTVTRADDLLLLPTPEDELTETAGFSGDFAGITIKYPRTMNVHPHLNVSNSLSFNAVMEDGTDDYYSNILLFFMPISGYDEYMSQGSATAKQYMKHMLEGIASKVYGQNLLKIFGSNFKDGGDHYSLTCYTWLGSPSSGTENATPRRGCIEVRYYGPIGYALVALTSSLESRIRNYFEICNAMLETCNLTANWSTAPKPVPQKTAQTKKTAAKPAQSSGSTGSSGTYYSGDSGDYGEAYYWYDEDGDIWYWDGYEDIFIGFGYDYYIDEDGDLCSDYWDYYYDDWDFYYDDYYDPWDDYDYYYADYYDDYYDDWDDWYYANDDWNPDEDDYYDYYDDYDDYYDDWDDYYDYYDDYDDYYDDDDYYYDDDDYYYDDDDDYYYDDDDWDW